MLVLFFLISSRMRACYCRRSSSGILSSFKRMDKTVSFVRSMIAVWSGCSSTHVRQCLSNSFVGFRHHRIKFSSFSIFMSQYIDMSFFITWGLLLDKRKKIFFIPTKKKKNMGAKNKLLRFF